MKKLLLFLALIVGASQLNGASFASMLDKAAKGSATIRCDGMYSDWNMVVRDGKLSACLSENNCTVLDLQSNVTEGNICDLCTRAGTYYEQVSEIANLGLKGVSIAQSTGWWRSKWSKDC